MLLHICIFACMMTTFHLPAEELDLSILMSIKEAYKGKDIEIIISDTVTSDKSDELLNRIENMRKNKNTVSFTQTAFFKKYGKKIADVSNKIWDWCLKELEEWIKIHPKTAAKIVDLLQEICKNPFEGKGKPKPLKHKYKGCWSRRINEEHRLIYEVTDSSINVLSCKGHYE